MLQRSVIHCSSHSSVLALLTRWKMERIIYPEYKLLSAMIQCSSDVKYKYAFAVKYIVSIDTQRMCKTNQFICAMIVFFAAVLLFSTCKKQCYAFWGFNTDVVWPGMLIVPYGISKSFSRKKHSGAYSNLYSHNFIPRQRKLGNQVSMNVATTSHISQLIQQKLY